MSERSPLLPMNFKRSADKHSSKYALVIHGGAGNLPKEQLTKEEQEAYKEALKEALQAGYNVLRAGGEALDAAVAAVTVMEDCPLFNAGKGAVFNVEGKNELESSVMLSKPPATHSDIPSARRGVSATLLTRARNPSKLIRALYLAPDRVPHPFVSGATAENVAAELGETLADPSYFYTEHRWREHRRGLGLPEEPLPYPSESDEKSDKGCEGLAASSEKESLSKGTVGAAALDVRGCIAAVTSTGGRTNKLVGRIGDTPQMGAGFWAEEWKPSSWLQKVFTKVFGRPTAMGVSGTGDGDYFIRQATASTIARRMQFEHRSLEEAAQIAVKDLIRDGGIGGVIALDSEGNVAMPLNCARMYRGVIREDGIPKTAIFPGEEGI